jgi:IS605 OrfB family transposase
LTKTPAIIVTEELGNNPQEEMIDGIRKDELRHRIKQTPFKNIEKAVEDKALERGSKLFHASSYRNSRVCPIHFVRLKSTDEWHTLQCPLGHLVHRDYASVMNMAWKLTPKAWTKGVWWDLRKKMDWGEYKDRHNPLVPYGIAILLQHIMENAKASLEKSPAVLARGKPMNPARGANEGRARKPPTPFQGREEVSRLLNR